MRDTWVYLSMKTSVLGTLLSPRWITELPTQPPRLFCVLILREIKRNREESEGMVSFHVVHGSQALRVRERTEFSMVSTLYAAIVPG